MLKKQKLQIATRESALALWQAKYVANVLQEQYPQLEIALKGITTKGDKILDQPLAKIGGKGLFIKELETTLLNGTADLAVHSMKDMPAELIEGLCIGALCPRADPRDAFVSEHFNTLSELPEGAIIGTASLRRQSQLKHFRPDLKLHTLRGNVNTRLNKLIAGEFDAIVLSAAGLQRLELDHHIKSILSTEQCLPAVGQGAIAIEVRSQDTELKELIATLNDAHTEVCITAERAMNLRLQGSCQVPIAGYAQLKRNKLVLTGLVGSLDGTVLIKTQQSAQLAAPTSKQSLAIAKQVGENAAQDLINKGAKPLLAAVTEP